jgi:hypothetical protein
MVGWMRQTGESQMPAFRQIRILLLASLAMPLLSAAGQLDEPTYDENVYVNCQYRLAVIFPKPPAFKDFTYTSAGKTAPARQFYTQEGTNQFSVTVVEFANGPAVDENLVMAATIPLQQRGQVRFQYMADYDPGIPGRQLDIFQPNGRQLRASVYMADHRLYITEATSAPGDFTALQFEQSVSILNAQGTDLDKNGNLPSRQYNCRK